MERCQPLCFSLIRGPTPATLNILHDGTVVNETGVKQLRHVEVENHPEIVLTVLNLSKKDYPVSTIISAMFPSVTHTTNKSFYPQIHQPVKTQLTPNQALLLITGKNNTFTFTLGEKPTHKKTHNKYTHHLKIKREKELYYSTFSAYRI